MPIHEYHCEPCGILFETLIRRADDVAKCPSCGGTEVAREFSAPASARVSGGGSAAPLPMAGGNCGRPQCAGGGCAGMSGLSM